MGGCRGRSTVRAAGRYMESRLSQGSPVPRSTHTACTGLGCPVAAQKQTEFITPDYINHYYG